LNPNNYERNCKNLFLYFSEIHLHQIFLFGGLARQFKAIALKTACWFNIFFISFCIKKSIKCELSGWLKIMAMVYFKKKNYV